MTKLTEETTRRLVVTPRNSGTAVDDILYKQLERAADFQDRMAQQQQHQQRTTHTRKAQKDDLS